MMRHKWKTCMCATTCTAPDVRRHPKGMDLCGWLVLGGQPLPEPRELQSPVDFQDDRWETATRTWYRCAGDQKYLHKAKRLARVSRDTSR